MFFRYFKEGASVEQKGQILRVLDANAQTWLDAKLENGEAKYTETTFQEWWSEAVADDTKAVALEGADEGEFWAEIEDAQTPGSVITIACSLETGEPLDEEAAAAPVEAEAEAEGTEAPAAPEAAASEAEQAPAEAGQAEQESAQ
jgi:hypothetical protein